MCETRKVPLCLQLKPGSACAAPTPWDISNYYNRHHAKDNPDVSHCKGACYCPDDCNCPHKDMNGRYVDAKSCDPCRIDESCCPPRDCCGSCGGGLPPRRPRRSSPQSCSCCCCCNDTPSNCQSCQPCCPPYKPPKRRPICYPPIKCCETNECGQSPKERICYSPCPMPPSPKYCTCGSPNPCECDLDARRRSAICELSPRCRRCGRKVYAAEKIMAANGAFHSSCFSCYCCHKPLEVTNVYENQGEIYCKYCYARYFGQSGYGYGSTLVSSL